MKYSTPSNARKRKAATEDRPLHIAMVGQRGIPATYGGIERVVEELAVRMVEQGHRVTVFCFERPLGEDRGPDQPSSYRGVELVYLPTAQGKHSEMLFHAFRSTIAAIGLRPDILHYHAVGPGLFSLLARLFSGARVVCTIHGRDDQQSKWSPKARTLLRFSARIASRVPHTTTVVARHLVNSIEEDFGRRPTYVTNGVTALAPVSPDSVLEELDLEPGRYFVQVARPIPDKASDVMFEAAALASNSMPVVLVGELGDDPYSDRVRSEVKSNPNARLAGARFGSEQEELLSNAAVLVQPSLLEGLPVALLEGISYGLPVICSDIPAHREVVGHGCPAALVVAAGDAKELAIAMDQMAGDLTLARDSQSELREKTLSHHDWDRIAEQFIEVYRDRKSIE